ncbi:hypothetical protein SCORR_v1c04110 [Spiroplasma corruscae]|uniref:Uncharacterized protein n=1 Tax=Spiroplasma corruscae TaxID=216934 RepID=A0A222ENU7_9MOLU|nr:hypothetical protein [Spiroplasma corruscae]ASP28185.1 hypothetical protein SCORR_v1c04110 [Spiroplasma corruscae]
MSKSKLTVVSSSGCIALMGFILAILVIFTGSALTIVIPSLILGLLIIAFSLINILFCFREVSKLKVSLVLSASYTILVIILTLVYLKLTSFSSESLYILSAILLFTIIFYTILIVVNFSDKIRTLEY